jgi:hypothetical protein
MKTKNEQTLYGQVVNTSVLDGICTGCRGGKDKNNKNKNGNSKSNSNSNSRNEEDIILCDGHGCCREYHLSCTDPPLLAIPEGEFYCPDCDPLGTTKSLKEYFDSVAEMKEEVSSRISVFEESLPKIERRSFKQVNSRKFVEDLIRERMKAEYKGPLYEDLASESSDSSHSKKRKLGNKQNPPPMSAPPMSEISRMNVLYSAALDDSKWRTEGDVLAQKEEINREFLIGKICKVYCTRDNEYHTGRIIDWRSAVPPNVDPSWVRQLFYGEGIIACTEFLVRFAAGTDGRKKTLLQWMILEEHAAAISVSLVMALKDKGRGMNGWRPGQLMLRTCIELIPIRNVMSKNDQYGLVTFFDLEHSIYLDLNVDAVSYASKAFLREFKKKISSTPTKKPKNFYVVNHLIEAVLGSADIESQEQMRTRAWYGLYLKDPYHKRALTLPDEYSTELNFETEKNDSEGIETQMPAIKLCPTIQRGLDKQWIASRLMKVSGEKSLDAMASMKVARLSRPKCIAMALINEQHVELNLALKKT